MNDLDKDLVRAFTLLQQPVDRIACFRDLREQFLAKLTAASRWAMEEDYLFWRLLQLRKSRKLPALHREAN